jgi:predicted metalloendopeptidase
MSGKNIEVVDTRNKQSLTDISERFGVVDTVRSLQKMMKEVTQKEITPDTVNAACNCVQNLNLTIKTAIQAARFLSGGKE